MCHDVVWSEIHIKFLWNTSSLVKACLALIISSFGVVIRFKRSRGNAEAEVEANLCNVSKDVMLSQGMQHWHQVQTALWVQSGWTDHGVKQTDSGFQWCITHHTLMTINQCPLHVTPATQMNLMLQTALS